MTKIVRTGEGTGIIPVEGGRPITVVGTKEICKTFEAGCIQQAINSRMAPGVSELVLNPDAHIGYGAPVGCVMVSPTHIYPGPVGVDIKCSMSLLQLDLPGQEVRERPARRALINAIGERIPTGPGRGQRHAKKARGVNRYLGDLSALHGGSSEVVLSALGIPKEWALRCEDSHHLGHDGTVAPLVERLGQLIDKGSLGDVLDKYEQLGSYGGGNHFGECELVNVMKGREALAEAFGLRDGCVAFLSHCGSRGFGNLLAQGQFRSLRSHFENWGIRFPGDDKELVYAPLGTPEANLYLDDMALGANFATINHLLINALVLEAFQEVFPGTRGSLVYFISHNIARQEVRDNKKCWVHRKGATRAFPAGHFALKGTPFEETGHPILLPGNPVDGSVVMVAEQGAEVSAFSVNHGAGRRMGRREAKRQLNQEKIDKEMDEHDVLSNCRQYPMDEAAGAYKDFREVVKSVEVAGLASTVARLRARFVIKDGGRADD